jgi:hypothetical protein
VDARRAVLGAANVDRRGIEINLLPANVDIADSCKGSSCSNHFDVPSLN